MCRSHPASSQFDRVAFFYPALEWLVFRRHLDRARQAFIGVVLEASRVLLVGEGNGRFLRSLMTSKISGWVTVVEKSAAMVQCAKDRIAGIPRDVFVEFLEADFLEWQPEKQFDCAVTHFFLDQFNPPTQLAITQKIAELTPENGTWINVDFLPPHTLGSNLLMWLQYTFFRMLTRIEAKRCFDESSVAAASGWVIAETIPYLGGLIAAKRYQKRTAAF